MKHLRRFNESLKVELQDFCDTHLAYLIDEGFKVRISKFEGDDFHQIMIGTPESSNSLWSQMKDYILPFLHFLFKDYELYYDNGSEPAMGIVFHGGWEFRYKCSGIKQKPLTLNQINDLPDDTEIATLYIRVVKKEDKEVKKAWFRNF
jgi:hypothetical protein